MKGLTELDSGVGVALRGKDTDPARDMDGVARGDGATEVARDDEEVRRRGSEAAVTSVQPKSEVRMAVSEGSTGLEGGGGVCGSSVSGSGSSSVGRVKDEIVDRRDLSCEDVFGGGC